jgi:hypothetical protein
MSSKYTIRLVDKSEITEVKDFIKLYLKKDHIFVTSDILFSWQHKKFDKYNFIIARNNLSNEIDAIMGFIPTAQFDPELTINNDYWGAIWAVSTSAPPGLGVSLIKYFLKAFKPVSYGSIGISNDAKGIFKILGKKIAFLNQYYIINPKADYLILKNKFNSDCKIKQGVFNLREMHSFDNIKLKHNYKPLKSISYLVNRYKNHPIYKYRFLGIYSNDNFLKAILIIRKQFYKNHSCFRIVDVYGDLTEIKSIEHEIIQFLIFEKSEYIDCLNYGIDENIFFHLGFLKNNFDENLIIPNYFEPFVNQNIKIDVAIKCDFDDYIIFKADADQDRPNFIE